MRFNRLAFKSFISKRLSPKKWRLCFTILIVTLGGIGVLSNRYHQKKPIIIPYSPVINTSGDTNAATNTKTAYHLQSVEPSSSHHIMSKNTVTKETEANYEYVIKKGDSLNSIFAKFGFDYKNLMAIMEADVNYLKIDTIQPGEILRFWQLEGSNQIKKMELEISLVNKIDYERASDGSYNYHEIKIPGHWLLTAAAGTVNTNFAKAALEHGLSNKDIEHISNLLKDKINFNKDIRSGDRFEIVQSVQYVNNTAVGNKELQAIQIHSNKGDISAYLNSKDGQFYDEQGQSLERAFLRRPFHGKFRVSSPFNPFRKHPLTGKIMPHNGVDWALPINTPVLASGDGVVTAILNHPYAGKYVVITHSSTYTSRYLHLSQTFVRKGERVSRGQRIAMSGASGRVTGPHLHYELIIRGHPVNPITAKIPMATSVSKNEREQFNGYKNELKGLMAKQRE